MNKIYFLVCVAFTSLPLYTAEENKPTNTAPLCPDCCKELALGNRLTISPWIDVAQRTRLVLDYDVCDQDSRQYKFGDLIDRPTAIAFLYTRCSNARKCPLAASTMSQLQALLKTEGIHDKVRLLIVTYDPEYDTPDVVRKYAQQRGFSCVTTDKFIIPKSSQKAALFKAMNIAVNFDSNGVSIHGLELLIFDKQQRIARTYHTLIWDNKKVLSDMKQLLSE